MKAGNTLLMKKIRKYKLLYLLILPAFLLILIFNYGPMYGIVLAFKDFKISRGVMGSEWVGFLYFSKLFSAPSFLEVLRNTVVISLLRIIFGFPAPIILAILFNELYVAKFRKFVQTVSYLPFFLSWVVLAGIFMEILSPQRGIVNYIITAFGGQPIYFLAENAWFRTVLITTGIWATAGWGTVIYMATITGIDPQLYESAIIDGANRFQQTVRITIPSLYSIIAIMFIINMGNILNGGFDQIFNLYNPAVYKVSDILDTYIYRRGLVDTEYSLATAAGFFKNAVGIFFVLGSNMISRRFSEYGVF